MYYCPKCNFTLDISKNIKNPNINEIKTPDDFIDLILDEDYDGITKLKFSKNDLEKNKNFKKLDKDKQSLVLNKCTEFCLDKTIDAFFICNNCNYHIKLISGTKIFTAHIKEKRIDDESLLQLRANDNTLPRTKDFICPKKDCKSNKKEFEHIREAVFYRPFQDEYNLKYICCTCMTSWDP
jgi:hypothetical protein